MSTSIVRSPDGWFVLAGDGAHRIDTTATTTGDLLADRAAIGAAVTAAAQPAPTGLLSPVTAPCRVVAQMTNYVSHIKDSGMNPATVPLTFFRKTSHSINGPLDDIVRPAHVTLLDYEVEIGLVIGKELPVGTTVTAANISEYVAGLVVTNDVSARDLQLPKTQFFEAKSYPTFTPVGPRLVLLDADDWKRFDDLRLRTWVNGELRQDSTVADMLFKPVQTFATLTGFQPLSAGDLLLTGTPGGTALKAPPKPVELIGALLPPALKWKAFFAAQAKNRLYLADGDVVELHVGTDDGAIDLGRQTSTVRSA
ncbi:MAG: fumarylacetoacetate hydrolase family protein [Marmoricola sp.]